MHATTDHKGRSFAPALALLIPLLLIGMVAFAVTGCFRVSSGTQALRDAALDNNSGQWDRKIQLNLGRLTFGMAQLGTSFVNMPPEARAALSSMKGAEFTVWKAEGTAGVTDTAAVLREADKGMTRRGWYRLVGVVKDDQVVAIYVPEKASSPRNFKLSVLVLNQSDLVCAAAHSDIQPLFALAMEKAKDNFHF